MHKSQTTPSKKGKMNISRDRINRNLTEDPRRMHNCTNLLFGYSFDMIEYSSSPSKIITKYPIITLTIVEIRKFLKVKV